jgi:hypothetical protein
MLDLKMPIMTLLANLLRKNGSAFDNRYGVALAKLPGHP